MRISSINKIISGARIKKEDLTPNHAIRIFVDSGHRAYMPIIKCKLAELESPAITNDVKQICAKQAIQLIAMYLGDV